MAVSNPDHDFNVERIGDVAAAVTTLARVYGVTDERVAVDDFADAASRLSDADAAPDRIERLLVALQRSGAIEDHQRFALHAVYLRQRPTTAAPEGATSRPLPDARTALPAPPALSAELDPAAIDRAAKDGRARRQASHEVMTYQLDGWVVREFPGQRIVRLAPIDRYRSDEHPLPP